MLKLCVDNRMAGCPRYYVGDGSPLVDIPQEIPRCVSFVGYNDKESGEVKLGGTAFFVFRYVTFRRNAGYVITAKHVLQGVKKKAADGKLLLRVNLSGGASEKIETSCDDWIEHPQYGIDVAVLPLNNTKLDLDHSFINTDAFAIGHVAAMAKIRIGEEIFITGLFVQLPGNERNIPIVRVGTIAALPGEKIHIPQWGGFEAYLVEVRSISGLSGSPVFAACDPIPSASSSFNQILGGSEENDDPGFCLMGLMLGHLTSSGNLFDLNIHNSGKSEGDRINTGIAMVVPAERIQEVLDLPVLRAQREQIAKEDLESNGATLD